MRVILCEPIGVLLSGDLEQVKFSVSIDNITVNVKWNELENNNYSVDDVHKQFHYSTAIECCLLIASKFGIM